MFYYFLFINIVTFAFCAYDKYCAIKQKWRISEKCLLIMAFLGGAVGLGLGMLLFRHKIRSIKFMILTPLFVVFHIALYNYFLNGFL